MMYRFEKVCGLCVILSQEHGDYGDRLYFVAMGLDKSCRPVTFSEAETFVRVSNPVINLERCIGFAQGYNQATIDRMERVYRFGEFEASKVDFSPIERVY